jgi:hypothetical protein
MAAMRTLNPVPLVRVIVAVKKSTCGDSQSRFATHNLSTIDSPPCTRTHLQLTSLASPIGFWVSNPHKVRIYFFASWTLVADDGPGQTRRDHSSNSCTSSAFSSCFCRRTAMNSTRARSLDLSPIITRHLPVPRMRSYSNDSTQLFTQLVFGNAKKWKLKYRGSRAYLAKVVIAFDQVTYSDVVGFYFKCVDM